MLIIQIDLHLGNLRFPRRSYPHLDVVEIFIEL